MNVIICIDYIRGDDGIGYETLRSNMMLSSTQNATMVLQKREMRRARKQARKNKKG